LYSRNLLDGASPSLSVDRSIERPPGDQQHPRLTDQGYPTRAICLVTTEGDEKEEGRNHETHPTPHCTGKEVGGSEHIQVETDRLPPGHGPLPFWRGGNAVTLEDIPYRLVTDAIAQVGQSTHNAIIAP